MIKQRKRKFIVVFTAIVTLSLTVGIAYLVYWQQNVSVSDSSAGIHNSVCNDIRIKINGVSSPYVQSNTVNVNSTVSISVTGLPTLQNPEFQLYYTSTSNDTKTGGNWKKISSVKGSQAGSTWTVNHRFTNEISSASTLKNPYKTSERQEVFISLNVFANGAFVCTGNPDPGISYEKYTCPKGNCAKVLTLEPSLAGSSPNIELDKYFTVKPGYSVTYKGGRTDNPIDDQGRAVSGDFTARMEYEAPVDYCGLRAIPQSFTKSNIWGYWQPARATKSERVNTWTDGSNQLKFYVTDPDHKSYPWRDGYWGALAFEMFSSNNLSLNSYGTSHTFYSLTTFGDQYYVYPPYMLAPDTINSGTTYNFSRVDSAVSVPKSSYSRLCDEKPKSNNHGWYTRVSVLNDSTLSAEFHTVKSAYNSQDMVVISFFESTDGGKSFEFREDWYLLKNVGLVGIDQAWFTANSSEATSYLNATYMKRGTVAKPDMYMRAVSAYTGGSLSITSNRYSVNPGGSYTFTVKTPQGLPYNGTLEVKDLNGDVSDWVYNNQLLWVENGKVTVNLASTFPKGVYSAYFRPRISDEGSGLTQIRKLSDYNYNSIGWSQKVTITVN